MWLVTQDGKSSINFNVVNFIEIQPNEVEFDLQINYLDNEWADIGTYENEERAKEILNEIVKACATYISQKIGGIYYMPEK